ncbi:MAG: hypothetical protein ChlgKO_10530 [Chlamydiales bacterium]
MKLFISLFLLFSTTLNSENKKLIVVLGMHRSGSSIMTKSLELLGAELGDHLLPPQLDNPLGFFEDIEIGMFNETALYLHGLASHSIKFFPSKLINEEKLIEYGKRLLLKKLEGKKNFCFKDPRTARNFPLWRKVIDELPNTDPYVIVIVRNPLSVAQSLYDRNGLDPIRSYYMWLLYYFSALYHSRGLPIHIIHYEELLLNPQTILQKVSRFAGLQMGEVDAFIDSRYQHHSYTQQELKEEAHVPIQVVELYETLRKEEKIFPKLSKIENFLSQIDPLLELTDREMHIGESREHRGFPLIEELIKR